MNTYWMWLSILAIIFLLFKVIFRKTLDNEDCE